MVLLVSAGIWETRWCINCYFGGGGGFRREPPPTLLLNYAVAVIGNETSFEHRRLLPCPRVSSQSLPPSAATGAAGGLRCRRQSVRAATRRSSQGQRLYRLLRTRRLVGTTRWKAIVVREVPAARRQVGQWQEPGVAEHTQVRPNRTAWPQRVPSIACCADDRRSQLSNPRHQDSMRL